MGCNSPAFHSGVPCSRQAGAASVPSQTLLVRPLPLSSSASQVSSLGFSFFITGSLLGVSLPIRVSQSCNYSSSSHDDPLPLRYHLPRLTVACCFICLTLLSRRRPSFVSPAVYQALPEVVLLFRGASESLLALIDSSEVCDVHHPSFVLISSLMPSSKPLPLRRAAATLAQAPVTIRHVLLYLCAFNLTATVTQASAGTFPPSLHPPPAPFWQQRASHLLAPLSDGSPPRRVAGQGGR